MLDDTDLESPILYCSGQQLVEVAVGLMAGPYKNSEQMLLKI